MAHIGKFLVYGFFFLLAAIIGSLLIEVIFRLLRRFWWAVCKLPPYEKLSRFLWKPFEKTQQRWLQTRIPGKTFGPKLGPWHFLGMYWVPESVAEAITFLIYLVPVVFLIACVGAFLGAPSPTTTFLFLSAHLWIPVCTVISFWIWRNITNPWFDEWW